MNADLKNRRQFILARNEVPELEGWIKTKISGCHLYSHPDLEITREKDGEIELILLGYIFDSFNPKSSNKEIMVDIIKKTNNYSEFIKALKIYSGRYALVYKDSESFNVLHDPLGVREINYCTTENKIICGSQPNFISALSEPKLGITEDPEALNYYNYAMKKVRFGTLWVGEGTLFKSINQLLPNHYLDINSMSVKRYWPNRRLNVEDVETIVDRSCEYLQGAIQAVTNRYDCMMAVTAGVDSRSLLAASREASKKIYYFVNKHEKLIENSPDIAIPKKIFKDIDIPFHIHEIDNAVDEDFETIFRANTYLYKENMISTIYNVYYKNHMDKVNLLGLGELGRDFAGKAPKKLDGFYLARSLKFVNSPYAVKACQRWLDEAFDVALNHNVDIMKLFVWEILIGNWAVVGNSESDIAIEEYDPYSSHYLYETIFSLDNKYGKDGIFEKMLEHMWPVLNDYPYNPPFTFMERVKYILNKFGIYGLLKDAKYHIDRKKYYANN